MITPECLDFIDHQGERISTKFFQLIEVITEIKIVHSNFIKKLINTHFYELRIKTGNEIRVIIFAVDHANFNECTKAICLMGFHKKSTKDYKKAIKQAEKILEKYL
ncbi:type II toxin-antitoxin system RelE/ParE family toxin [Candidatus Sulfidibacterium hydrothermale]|uniref:type II toxin-antitoxin system RelE/ParE family toxin n=1 Tax=Candidatus Sulfidibacterium hydrothermale TaxID=2875962 RepID=UPI001F0ABEB1|nr:type II toxin-antitoxin system RelE/ParE family toxin [Candidatus Sulfidibacterium hydrothermale]UBM62085.1 type II toxin-antitoxin system RelE/ParE family toxin [Candidatus Sulfidibacterium hydrothermale]